MSAEREIIETTAAKCVCKSVLLIWGNQQAGRLVAAGLWD